jgi:antitoxin ParD1/3/4
LLLSLNKKEVLMNVSLTPVLEKLIQKKVKSGAYNNASEVVREALRLLEEQDKIKELKLQKLKAELQIGLDQLNNQQYSNKSLQSIAKSIKKK